MVLPKIYLYTSHLSNYKITLLETAGKIPMNPRQRHFICPGGRIDILIFFLGFVHLVLYNAVFLRILDNTQ